MQFEPACLWLASLTCWVELRLSFSMECTAHTAELMSGNSRSYTKQVQSSQQSFKICRPSSTCTEESTCRLHGHSKTVCPTLPFLMRHELYMRRLAVLHLSHVDLVVPLPGQDSRNSAGLW